MRAGYTPGGDHDPMEGRCYGAGAKLGRFDYGMDQVPIHSARWFSHCEPCEHCAHTPYCDNRAYLDAVPGIEPTKCGFCDGVPWVGGLLPPPNNKAKNTVEALFELANKQDSNGRPNHAAITRERATIKVRRDNRARREVLSES